MANWFVRINHRKENKDSYYSQQVERRLYFDLETKKDVLTKIKEDYPEYFQKRYLKELRKENSFLSMFMN